jgi:hypothetical protein
LTEPFVYWPSSVNPDGTVEKIVVEPTVFSCERIANAASPETGADGEVPDDNERVVDEEICWTFAVVLVAGVAGPPEYFQMYRSPSVPPVTVGGVMTWDPPAQFFCT